MADENASGMPKLVISGVGTVTNPPTATCVPGETPPETPQDPESEADDGGATPSEG